MKKILNLGCGNSKYGTHRIDLFKTSTTTETCDLNKKLPYKDNYFDEIYCNCVLEHIKNIGTLADECYRVLKKGGKIYVHTDHAGYVFFYLLNSHEHNNFLNKQYERGICYGHQKGEDRHYHLFVKSHLMELFCNFKERKVSYSYGGRNKIINRLLKLIPRKMGAIGISIYGKK